MNVLARCLLLTCLLPAVAARAEDPHHAAAANAEEPPVAAAGAEEPVSLDEIRRFVSVFRAVKQAYVDPVDDATLMRSAIRGLLADLDPHSGYLDAEQSRDLNEQTSGAYDGLGLEVVQRPDRSLMVVAPIDGTPAARAGIRPGDIISAIDDEPISAANVDVAVERMRGEPGSAIQLTILRESEPEPLRLTLVRETIRVLSARGRLLAPGFGYLRIAQFQSDTAEAVARVLGELAPPEAPLQGLVLDLRSNPGGLLGAAVAVADHFLDGGLVVATRGRTPYASSEYHARPGDRLNGAPLVILADGGTASAAEVLAGALREHRRALVMGSPSFGKGSVQTVLPLDNGDALKLTTARYYGPAGRSIQATGLLPDIVLADLPPPGASDSRLPSLRERDLPGHLENAESAAPEAAATPAEPIDDHAIGAALALLKGLALFRPPPG